jgi:hypothetical protein
MHNLFTTPRFRARFCVTAVVIACAVACGSNSPTAPTPPVVAPPPTTRIPVLTFTAATNTPVGAALAIQVASRGQEAGKIAIAITAHNLNGVVRVRGGLRWDRNLLEYDTWGEGDWFKQGGALVDWQHFTSTPGQLTLFLDRPTTLPGASGSGEILLIRLKPRAGVLSGSSQIQWDEPAIYPVNFSALPLNNVYGGTITIQ